MRTDQVLGRVTEVLQLRCEKGETGTLKVTVCVACWEPGWRRMWSCCSRGVQIIVMEEGVARADRRMRSFQQQDKGLKANSTGKVVKPVRIMTGY